MCVSISSKMSVSNFIGYLRGKSTLMIYNRHSEQQSKWNKTFRARRYYVATVGNVTEDAIKKYNSGTVRGIPKEKVTESLFSNNKEYTLAASAFQASSNRVLGGNGD